MNEVDALRERVAQACRIMGKLELAKAATGHVSARLPGTDRIFIRARGPGELGVRFTTKDQIVEIDLDGELARTNGDGLESPKEVFIHTAIYRARDDVFGVVHGHPLTAVLFTICNKPLLPLYGAYDPPSAKLAIDGIPSYPHSFLCDSPERGEDLAMTLGRSSCCMMQGHGITTCGPNVEEAALTAIHLNDLADINFKASLLGSPKAVPENEQQWIRDSETFAPSTSKGALPQGRAAVLWRYYCSLCEA